MFYVLLYLALFYISVTINHLFGIGTKRKCITCISSGMDYHKIVRFIQLL